MGHADKPDMRSSPDLAMAVEQALTAGEYASASRIVRDTLRDWKEQRGLFGYTLEELRALVQEGLDRGSPEDGPSTMEELSARIRARFEDRP